MQVTVGLGCCTIGEKGFATHRASHRRRLIALSLTIEGPPVLRIRFCAYDRWLELRPVGSSVLGSDLRRWMIDSYVSADLWRLDVWFDTRYAGGKSNAAFLAVDGVESAKKLQ